MSSYSPWGAVQDREAVADGVVFVSTASHGGFHVSAKLNNTIPEPFRHDGGWYEEDVDYSIVIVFLPHLFKAEEVERAKETLKNWYPTQWEQHFKVELSPEESRGKRELLFREANRGRYQVSAAWGDWHEKVPAGMVGVVARKIDEDGPERWVLIPKPDYTIPFILTGAEQAWPDHA